MIPAALDELLADPKFELVRASIERGFTAPPSMTVSEWATRYRRMSTKSSAEDGPWDITKTPYLREIMDRLSPQDPCETVVFMAASQLGKTECGNNWVGYVIHCAPGPMLAIQSTVELAKDWSKRRLEPLIAETPELLARVGTRKSRDTSNTIQNKAFPGGMLSVRGGNAPTGLRATPIRYLFLDEYSSYPRSAGKEGDPGRLAIARTRAFPNRKIFKCSTPLRKGECRIERDYERTDMRRYEVACPFCGTLQFLEPDRLRWVPGRPETCVYGCRGCDKGIREEHKYQMLNAGTWVATAEAKDPRTHGYQLSTLYSLMFRWEEIAALVEVARASKDPIVWQDIWNTIYGLPYEDASSTQIDTATLLGWRTDWWRTPTGELGVPADVGVLVAAVDVQDNRLEAIVYGVGRDRELWRIDWRAFYGRPSNPRVWAQLDEYLDRTFPHETAPDGMRIAITAIDSSAHTQDVYDYCLERWHLKRYPIKGRRGEGLPAWPARGRQSKRDSRATFFQVGIDTVKTWLFARLLERDAQGRPTPLIHFSQECDAEFFDQLLAERRVPVVFRGVEIMVWEKLDPGARNEGLDLTVYAIAAMHALLQEGLDLDHAVEVAQQRRNSDEHELEHAELRGDKRGVRRPGWLGRRH